jgi:hypothetical protein
MSPDFTAQGSPLRPTKDMQIHSKPTELGDPADCSNRRPTARSGLILQLILRFVLVMVMAIGTSCSGKRITKANVDQVTEGMSKKQVESILGPPTSINNEDFIIMKKTTYLYRQGKDTVTIVFKDDKVQSKDSTLSH